MEEGCARSPRDGAGAAGPAAWVSSVRSCGPLPLCGASRFLGFLLSCPRPPLAHAAGVISRRYVKLHGLTAKIQVLPRGSCVDLWPRFGYPSSLCFRAHP